VSRTQPVTEADLRAGRIRIPIGAKGGLPPSRERLHVWLRSITMTSVAWDPRLGPDRERSGVLYIGSKLAAIVQPGEVLDVQVDGDAVTIE